MSNEWFEPEMLGGEFRFTVGRRSEHDGEVEEVRYVAELPHQCDGWTIANETDPAVAVKRLDRFVGEAKVALAVLRREASLSNYGEIVIKASSPTVVEAPPRALVAPEMLARLTFAAPDVVWIGNYANGNPCHYRVTGWDEEQKKLILEWDGLS